MTKNTLGLCAVFFMALHSSKGLSELKIGQALPSLTLTGDDGGLVDGKPWDSKTMLGKVRAFFYVDPDEKDVNLEMEEALAAEKFPADKYGSVAVINLDATWIPNTLINGKLEAKQEKYPQTVYVKDLDKVLVKKWSLKDDEYDVIVFDKAGKVLFSKDGKLSPSEIKGMIEIIRKNL